MRSDRNRKLRLRAAIAAGALVSGFAISGPAIAQQQGPQEGQPPSMTGAAPMPGRVEMPNIPAIGLQALPGYGVAPLTVGFSVMAMDPENSQFTAFTWNFGDGQVSTLPPLMLFHTYKNPGNYVATVTATTDDGRSRSAFTGVIVKAAGF